MNVPKNQYVGKSVAGVETCNKTLNLIVNPACGIEERESGGKKRKETMKRKEERREKHSKEEKRQKEKKKKRKVY